MSFKPPNESIKNGNLNGSGPLTKHASTVHGSNEHFHNGNVNGSFPLGKSGSPITPPNHEYAVGHSNVGWPAPAVAPGKGAIPVDPFTGKSGLTVPSELLPDSTLRRGK